MRHRNVWAAGLALGLGLCAAGIALGDEPAGDGGNWFSRLFSRSAPAALPKDPKEEKVVPVVPIVPVLSPAAMRAQAQMDYWRRIEVCLRLQDIALQNGDNELLRKAEQLEQRAKDLLDQRSNGMVRAPSSFDEQVLESQLAPKQGLTPLTATTGKSTDGQASAEGRK